MCLSSLSRLLDYHRVLPVASRDRIAVAPCQRCWPLIPLVSPEALWPATFPPSVRRLTCAMNVWLTETLPL